METQNKWTMWVGQAGSITPEAQVVLMTRSAGGHLLALPHGVFGGRVLLLLGSLLHVREGLRLPNPLIGLLVSSLLRVEPTSLPT